MTSSVTFQSTQPEWAATQAVVLRINAAGYFNPRSPSGLRQQPELFVTAIGSYFNPRSPSGLRQRVVPAVTALAEFQSTQPEWAATNAAADAEWINPFQSTQPEWAATAAQSKKDLEAIISIHAARVGCDQEFKAALTATEQISIHAARVGCDGHLVLL